MHCYMHGNACNLIYPISACPISPSTSTGMFLYSPIHPIITLFIDATVPATYHIPIHIYFAGHLSAYPIVHAIHDQYHHYFYLVFYTRHSLTIRTYYLIFIFPSFYYSTIHLYILYSRIALFYSSMLGSN